MSIYNMTVSATSLVNKSLRKRASLARGIATLFVGGALMTATSSNLQAQITWSGTTNGTWLTGTNWTLGTPAGSPTTTTNTDIAVFNVNLNNTVGIGMNTTAGVYYLGAIDNTNATARTINNSSTTPGILTLNGATVNSVANTIVRNNTTTLLTITNGATTGTMGLELGNATDNIIQLTGTGGITIPSIISGAGRNLTKQGAGTGVLTLSGVNTYSGTTTISAGILAANSSSALGDGSATNTLIFNGGTLRSTAAITSPSTRGVTLTSTGIIDTNNFAVSIAGNMTGGGGLTKNSLGTLTLSGVNNYGGVTTVNGGILQFANQASLYNSTAPTAANMNVKAGATFAVNVDSAGTAGFLETELNAVLANISVASSATSGLQAGANIGIDTTTAAGATFTPTAIIANSTGAFGGAIGLNKLGTGTLVLDLANSYTGPTIVSGGTLQLGSGIGTGSLNINSPITIGTGATFAVNQNDTVTQGVEFSGAAITGTGGFTQAGSGTTVLNVVNTFSGPTTVSAGTLTLSNANALQNSPLVTTSGTSTIGAFSAVTIGGLSGATGDLGSANVLNGYTGNVTALTLNPQTGVSVTYGGVISNGSGNMTLTKTGAGTQILTGANTYTGATIVNAGTLALGVGGSLNSSSALQVNGGTFSYDNTSGGQTVNGLAVGVSNSTVNNTAAGQTLTLGAITRTASLFGTVNFANLTGPISTTTGNTNSIIGPWATTGATTTLRYAVGSPDGVTPTDISALTGTTATAGTLVDVTDATMNYEYSAAAATATDLTANTLRYSGGTAATVTAIGAANTLTLNGLMNAGTGLLTISGGPTTGGILIGSTGELVIATNTQGTTISAAIGGTGRLVYSGAGTTLLSSTTSNYTGGTVINSGQLRVSSNAALGDPSGSITLNGGALVGNSTNPQVGNAGGVNVIGARDVIVGPAGGSIGAHGNNNFTTTGVLSGSSTLTQLELTGAGGRTLNFNSTANTFTGRLVVLSAGNTLSVNSLVDTAGSGNIALTLGIQNSGSAFAYGAGATAPLTLNNRAIELNASGPFSATIQNNNITQAISIGTDLIATGAGAKTLTLGALGSATVPANVFSGIIGNGSGGGTVALNKTGVGLWILNGANTYTGLTNVNAGVLNIQHANALGTISNGTTVANAATLQLQGGFSYAAEPLTLTPGTAGGIGMLNNLIGNNTWNGPITSSTATSTNVSRIQSDADLLTLAGPISLTGSAHQFVLQGNGNITVTGQITGVGRLTSSNGGTGIRTVSNDTNNFTGAVSVNGGTLAFTSIDNVGALASSLGAPVLADATILLAATNSPGTLRYIGTAPGGHTSDRVINLASTTGAPTIEANGVGPLVFTLPLTATGAGIKTLTLGGTNTGNNSIAAIVDNSVTNTTGVTKSGVGTWVLTGANTQSGTTTVNQGTLTVGATGTLSASTAPLSVNNDNSTAAGTAAILNLSTVADTTVGSLSGTIATPTSGTNTATINNGGIGRDFTVNQTAAGAYAGVIAGGGSFTLGSLSTNTLTLSGNNTYLGTTTVSAGKLLINGNNSAATGAVNVSALATLGGSGTIGGTTTVASTGIVAPGNSAGNLTFGSGLNLSAGGVYSWELGALSVINPGTDFDTITVSGGNLALAGTSALTLDFNLVSGTDPNSLDTFWTTGKTWKIIDVTTGTNTGGTNLSTITNASYSSGSFTTTVGAGGDLGDIFLVFTPVPAGPPTWIGASGDNWTAGTSWTGTVPNSAAAEAQFTTTGGAIANLNVDQTVNKLTFNATTSNDYTISGPGKLTLAGTTPAISLAATNTGDQTISTNVELGAGTTITVSGGSLSLNVPTTNATLGAGVTATVATGATLNLGGAGNALSNGTTTHANVTNNGTLAATTAGKRVGNITGTGTTDVTAASATLTATSIRQSVLSIGATSQATVTPSLGNKPAGISVFTNTAGTSLSIAAGGNFDTNDNDLIVYYQTGLGAATLATIQQQIIDGFLGTPAVAKISSSTGAIDMDKFLVAFDNSGIGLTDWEGVTLTGTDQIIAKYTLFGDLNLDGEVNSFDYSVIDSNFGTGNSWLTGDANLDGMVNSFDYSTVDTHFGKSFPMMGGGAGAGLSIAAVPEPSTFVLGGLAVLGLAGYRLRRRGLKTGAC